MKRQKLRMLRLAHNLTYKDMADKLGRSRSAYIKIERGERNPTPDFWENLKQEFNIPEKEMYGYQRGSEENEK